MSGNTKDSISIGKDSNQIETFSYINIIEF